MMTNKEAAIFLSQVKVMLLNSNSWLESTKNPIKESFDMAITALEKQIETLPPTEPEIIKCKDCKYWKQQTYYQGSSLSFGFCENDDIRIYTNDNHYCGYAERRTDGRD